MAFFLKLKLNHLSKMHGYPKFYFWIPRIITKIYLLRIVLNRVKNIPVLISITNRKPEFLRCAERMRNNNSRPRLLKGLGHAVLGNIV